MIRHSSNPALTFLKVLTKNLHRFIRLITPDSILPLLEVNICFAYSFYLPRGRTNMSSLFCVNLSATLLIRAVNFQILTRIHACGQAVELHVRGVHLVRHKLNHWLSDGVSYFFLFFGLWTLYNLFWFCSRT